MDSTMTSVLDQHLDRMSAPATSRVVEPSPAEIEAEARLLDQLLQIARDYHDIGALRQAIEMFFDLVRRYPDTPQAGQARERLLMIAEQYRHNGELRSTRAILEQLLAS